MAGYKSMLLVEPGQPRLVFYIPDSMKPDYAVTIFPGFAKPPEFYDYIGRLFAENGTAVVISDWDDGRRFSEETMIETAYRPADMLRNGIHNGEPRFGHVVGIGHSYGGERLLKAALLDTGRRFSAISVVQPPDRLGKYIGNHSMLYRVSKMPAVRAAAISWGMVRKRSLNVRTLKDQANLVRMIDSDTSLLRVIDSVKSYNVPTQFIYSEADQHVSYRDAIEAQGRLREKGVSADSISLRELNKYLTKEQMEEVFEFSRAFFEHSIHNEQHGSYCAA